MAELTSSIPGIDEAMSFAELMKQVQTMEYSVIVFDTAPTGHTLRLIQFPAMLEKGLGKVLGMKDKFGGLLSTVIIITCLPCGLVDFNTLHGPKAAAASYSQQP